jgi:hypothetical protein
MSWQVDVLLIGASVLAGIVLVIVVAAAIDWLPIVWRELTR